MAERRLKTAQAEGRRIQEQEKQQNLDVLNDSSSSFSSLKSTVSMSGPRQAENDDHKNQNALDQPIVLADNKPEQLIVNNESKQECKELRQQYIEPAPKIIEEEKQEQLGIVNGFHNILQDWKEL